MVVFKKWAFLVCFSAKSITRFGLVIAIIIPGKPLPEPRSRILFILVGMRLISCWQSSISSVRFVAFSFETRLCFSLNLNNSCWNSVSLL